jgi:hypothetical protein
MKLSVVLDTQQMITGKEIQFDSTTLFDIEYIPVWVWQIFCYKLTNKLTLWRENPNVHHCIHNSPLPAPILNPLHTTPSQTL